MPKCVNLDKFYEERTGVMIRRVHLGSSVLRYLSYNAKLDLHSSEFAILASRRGESSSRELTLVLV